MKRFIFFARLLVFLVVPVYADSVPVYVTATGDCYHKYQCPYAPDSIAVPIEYAFLNYRPCLHCNPPVVEWDTNKESYVAVETFYAPGSSRSSKRTQLMEAAVSEKTTQSGGRYEEMKRQLQEVDEFFASESTALESIAQFRKNRIGELNTELEDTKDALANAQSKLNRLERTLRGAEVCIFSLVALLFGILFSRHRRRRWFIGT